MSRHARYCLYFTAPPDGALDRLGASVLGYDAHMGADVEPLPLPATDAAQRIDLVREPQRYGFHATLKAPFRLREGETREHVLEELRRFAGSADAVPVGPLVPAALGAFLALVPAAPCRELDLLSAEIVSAFDRFRAPLSGPERARRLSAGLTRRQAALLDRWGYPFVFDQFRFHMTLSGPLPDRLRDAWREAMQELTRDLPPVVIDAVTLLEQPEPSSRFRVIERVALEG